MLLEQMQFFEEETENTAVLLFVCVEVDLIQVSFLVMIPWISMTYSTSQITKGLSY